jgi:ribosomal protein L40E
MRTGVFDKNGIEVKEGDIIRESHKREGREEFDVAVGEIVVIRGCHILDLGTRGKYTLYDRHPEKERGLSRVWEIMTEQQFRNGRVDDKKVCAECGSLVSWTTEDGTCYKCVEENGGWIYVDG